MPIHDWTRVDAVPFHAFHHRWIDALCDALNTEGLPPDGPVEVARDIQSRPALEVDLLDHHGCFAFERSGHAGMEGRSLGDRPEAKHLEELGLQPRPDCLPLGPRRR